MAGQPPKIKSPKEMQKKMEAYFQQCDADKKPYTVPGLALGLGLATRQSLLDYSDRDPGYLDAVKKAKLRIEAQRNSMMIEGKGNVIGAIFDLKNNFGWKDKQEHELSGVLAVANVSPEERAWLLRLKEEMLLR